MTSGNFAEESREIKREKQQRYAAELQEQIRIRTASRRDVHVVGEPTSQRQAEEARITLTDSHQNRTIIPPETSMRII